MSKHLGPTKLYELLAPSIKGDEKIRAVSTSLEGVLEPIIKSIPLMLWWARLWQDEKYLSPPMQRLVKYTGGLKPLSDAELELLAWQMHVDFWDIKWPRKVREDLVKYSTDWHRLKGTPQGVKKALELFGLEATIEEDGTGDNWATWQLGLKNVDDYNIPIADLANTALKVAWEMQPQRCKLFRIYNNEFDLRPIYTSLGPSLSEGYLSFYSGIRDSDKDLIISFGQRLKVEAEKYNPESSLGFTLNIPFSAPYLDYFRLGVSKLGDSFPRNHAFTFYEKIVLLSEDNCPIFSFLPRLISRNQASLSEVHQPLSSENYRLGKSFASSVDKPPILGLYPLSSSMGRKEFVVHEHFTKLYSFQTNPLDLKDELFTGFAFYQKLESGTSPLHEQGWKGSKNSKRWWNYLGFSEFNNKEN